MDETCSGINGETELVLRNRFGLNIIEFWSISRRCICPLVGNDWHNIHERLEHENSFHSISQGRLSLSQIALSCQGFYIKPRGRSIGIYDCAYIPGSQNSPN